MTVQIRLQDPAPVFGVDRDAHGEVRLTIRAGGATIRVSVGRIYGAALLGESLRHLAEDVTDTVLHEWQDAPDDADGYITVDRGRYHVTLDTAPVGDYPSQEIAEIELARAMAARGVFPPAWLVGDRLVVCDINDRIRGWHDAGGDGMAPIDGVQYRPGDPIWYRDGDWPYRVIGDWGRTGVDLHTDGDPTVRVHVTDRTQLRPITD
jgi:hypothetical protein